MKRRLQFITFLVCLIMLFGVAMVQAQNPGGVAGAKLWLKADDGVTTVDGTAKTTWNNQAAAINVTGTGTWSINVNNLINFNPIVAFNGTSNFYLTNTALFPNGVVGTDQFFVLNSAFSQGNVLTNFGDVNSSGNRIVISLPFVDGLSYWDFAYGGTGAVNANGRLFSNVSAASANLSSVFTFHHENTTANGHYFARNGTTVASNTTTPALTFNGATYPNYSIGAGQGVYYAGKIGESIAYSTALTLTQRHQVESYLSIKYGTTLPYDYLASDGTTTTYAISGYANNIAGIGRDANTALLQKQSQSENAGNQVTISQGTVTATNVANTNTFAADKQFLIWGDDNASITATTAITGPANLTKRLNRTWKLQNTGTFGQQVTVYFPTASVTLAGAFPALIYAPTAAGLSSNTAAVAAATTTTATISGVANTGFVVTFPTTGTLYFTFAGAPTACTPPTITTQPTPQTLCTGQPVTFSVAAAGTSPTYQWNKNGSPISGATGASYSIAAISAGDGANYNVTVGGCSLTTGSNQALLTVNTPAIITTPPAPVAICANGNATFTVTPAGTGPFTYQWQVSADGGASYFNESTNGGTAPAVSGVGTASLTYANYPASLGNRLFRVVVTGTCGAAVTSAAAQATLNTPVAITTTPVDKPTCVGTATTFSVAATGTGLTYVWQLFNGTGWFNIPSPNTDGNGSMTGSLTQTLTVTPANAAWNNFQFRAIVSGTCAPLVTSAAVTMTVNRPPAITTQPAAEALCAGTAASFSVTATGTGIIYQWRKNGTDITGATAATYTIPSVTAADAADYDVVVSGTCAPAVTSNVAALTVGTPAPPTLTTNTQPICTVITGTFIISNYNAAYTYAVSPATGVSQNGDIVTAPAGTYTVTAASGACSSVASASQTINPAAACDPPVSNGINVSLIKQPVINESFPLSGTGGNLPAPYGSDPQDGNLGGAITTSTVVINQLPTNFLLAYNGAAVSQSQEIPDFDASLMTITLNEAGTTSTSFHYTFRDADGMLGNDAIYTITWTTPLPVKLVSFMVKEEGSTVRLNWSTTEELNADRFDIERSADAKTWKTIGEKAAAGESKALLNYNFTDATPLAGLNYYRLKMIDKDATFAFSSIKSVDMNTGSSIRLTVYPNPVAHVLYLKDAAGSSLHVKDVSKVSIISMNGLTVYKASFAADISVSANGINVDKLNNGIYTVKITRTDGTISMHKVVIAK